MCPFTAGTGPGQTVGLNLKTRLYIGGVDWTDIRVSPSVHVHVGFVGCIAEVSIVVEEGSLLPPPRSKHRLYAPYIGNLNFF